MKKVLSLTLLALTLSLALVPPKLAHALSSYIASGTMGDSANTTSALVLRDTSGDFAARNVSVNTVLLAAAISTTALVAVTPVQNAQYLVFDLNADGTSAAGFGLVLTTSTNGTGLGNFIWLSTRATANIGSKVS